LLVLSARTEELNKDQIASGVPEKQQKEKSKGGTGMNLRKQWAVVMAGILAFAGVTFARDRDPAQKEEDRIANSGVVMKEILNVPDDIPRDLLDKARCIVVVPSVLKAAFIIGADYGRGTMVCRTGKDFSGSWGAPAMYALEGGSIGFQIGGEATDFVFLIMNDRGANSLLHSKVKLGADASIAAGPVGRDAAADTDAYLRSEILSYSRARGVFAGVSLEGSTLRPDSKANRELYGHGVTAAQIIRESEVQAPPSANALIAVLENASPRLKS
jgi:SH3 domain-containing YSC84-like protein 1